jgi:hypothetical protein
MRWWGSARSWRDCRAIRVWFEHRNIHDEAHEEEHHQGADDDYASPERMCAYPGPTHALRPALLDQILNHGKEIAHLALAAGPVH